MSEGSAVERAHAIEERLDVPVLLAALSSVPAVFLTMAGGFAAVLGTVVNTVSGLVLVVESLVLFLLSRSRLAWLRAHRNELLVALTSLPAVLLLVGPVQVFRLIIFVSAARLLRVRRILGAADVIERRADLPRSVRRLVPWAVAVVALVFLLVVLVDPESLSHRVIEWCVGWAGVVPMILVGLAVVAAWLLMRRYRPFTRLARRVAAMIRT